jgi:hypothetical protein
MLDNDKVEGIKIFLLSSKREGSKKEEEKKNMDICTRGDRL